jgi:hypothetical protein
VVPTCVPWVRVEFCVYQHASLQEVPEIGGSGPLLRGTKWGQCLRRDPVDMSAIDYFAVYAGAYLACLCRGRRGAVIRGRNV